MELDLSKYETRNTKRNYINSPETEIRDKMSDLLQQEFKVVCGRTKGMTADEMYRMYNRCISWGINPRALLHKLLKERAQIIKEQKNGIQKTGGN